MAKYKIKEAIQTSDFYYDITDGGYIRPAKILADQERAMEINKAIKVVEDWRQELYDDEMLEDL